jgi:hypothetical protein
VVARGVAPAFWVNLVELTLNKPAVSVTQTWPPADVEDVSVIVPANTPLASIEPDPNDPVVGAVPVSLEPFILILQVVQLAVNPPPVTVTVAPRAAVDGVKLTKLMISYVPVVTAVVSAEDFTVRVKAALARLAF